MSEIDRYQCYTTTSELSESSGQAKSGSFVRKLCFWKRKPMAEKVPHRIVVPNHTVPEGTPSKLHPNTRFTNNKIRTTKYTLLSFIPKNLFEQFHRFANLYFLGIVLLNWLPFINAFGKEISMIPVLFVMGVTAIKDAFEDRRRYISDKRVNNYTCRVYSRSDRRYVKTLWKNVKVGDIVHLSCNEIIPADILLLRSSEEQGLCYIETSNLDGESNLKQRQVVRGFSCHDISFHPTDFQGIVECDPPNNKIYKFNGFIHQKNGEKISISRENLLLRDCILKNTDFIEGIVVYAGHETKAMLNNGGPRYKRSKLERFMNRDVVGCIIILLLMCSIGATGSGLWLASYENKTLVPFIPFESEFQYSPGLGGFLSFWTYVIILQVMIPLSLYVTIEIIKLGQVYHIHQDRQLHDRKSNKHLECRALNIPEELGQVEYVFSDKTGTLTENRMVFQRCTIGGVDYNHTLSDTADAGVDHHHKNCGIENENIKNKYEVDPHFTLNPNLKEELSKLEIQLRAEGDVAMEMHISTEKQLLRDFFILMAVCNTVVVSKYPHKDQMNSSGLYLNTAGTLNFHHHGILGNGDRSLSNAYTRLKNHLDTPPHSATSTPVHRPCHLPLPSSRCNTPTPTPSPGELRPIYEAESPDEIALVDAAYRYNCGLLHRTPDSAVIIVPGEGVVEFKVLHVLPFDSVRKRMSVIIQHPVTKERVLYCKGADSSIFPQLAPTTDPEMREIIFKTQQHLNNYSRKGLRILCMAKKVLSQEEYVEWLQLHQEVELALDDRDQKILESADRIEKDLELLGATGIEDRLQEGVPDCIAALHAAGIVMWVLTGDKQETAVNIAYSCHLFAMDMEVITLNARSKEATEDTIRFYLDQIEKDLQSEPVSHPRSVSVLPNSSTFISKMLPGNNHSAIVRLQSQKRKKRALVLDGRTLAFVLERNLDRLFLELAQHCSAVLCCRATPLQKAYVVKMVKDKLGVLTLAIGDGANDVSMIQTADVGVGISGQEGMQAVMASDFALPRFCFLERLLLVHGHWCYDRLARTVLYFFYKNASFIYIIFWYQLYCGFSGSVMIDQLYLMLFNVLFTALPPTILGIYDQDCPADLLLTFPALYSRGRRSEIYTKYSFWITMVDALYQSIVIFFIPAMVYNDSDVGIWEFGTTVLSSCVFVQLIHVSIETRSWTGLHVISVFTSVIIYYLFAVIYNWVSVGTQSLQNPYKVIHHALQTPCYWFSLLLICVLGTMPRLTIRTLQTTLQPSNVVKTLLCNREQRRSKNKSMFSVSWSCQSSEASIIPTSTRMDCNALHCHYSHHLDEGPSVPTSSGSVQMS